MQAESFDVAIVGGGPAGSTTGALLKKYAPDLRVAIFEREHFPRDHVGESQLPEIGKILDEMGVWDKVEAAGFPIKIGATYRWGADDRLWDFEFIPLDRFPNEPRPARYEGARQETAFQVDRSIYDKILLDHARELGCDVREGVSIESVETDGDTVTGWTASAGAIHARHYVDCSGNAGIVRRAFNIPADEPTQLQNVAFWDYWQNVAWAESIGTGPTRIQVMSLGWGWIWFIPLGPTRTSVGLVVPAKTYKASGVRPAELYERALREEPRIRALLDGAVSEGRLTGTKDWSFLVRKLVGPNWFLAGESAGFADPILSAGMTLAHAAAKEVAYTILSLERGEHDPDWLRNRYETAQTKRILQHIRFAEFWYAANGVFTDLKEYTSEIARDAGLSLDANEAFRWLSTGGFTNETYGGAGAGSFSIEAIKQFAQRMTNTPADWNIARHNVFRMNVKGARKGQVAAFHEGRIYIEDSVIRDGRELPLTGLYGVVALILRDQSYVRDIGNGFAAYFAQNPWLDDVNASVRYAFHTLEAMIAEGWVTATLDPTRPCINFRTPDETLCMHSHTPEGTLDQLMPQ